MRAAALCLLAIAAVWPHRRWAGASCAALAAIALVWSTWSSSFRGRDNHWAAIVAGLVVVGLWWSTPKVHQRLSSFGGGWGLLLGSAIAIYGCVPETDQMREVAVVLGAGCVAEAVRRRPLPDPTLLAAAGLVAWSALYGATGRPSALVGGLFALLPCVAVAVGPRRDKWVPWVIGMVWAGAAVAVARTGGIATELRPAVAWAGVFGAAALGVTALVYALSAGHARLGTDG